MWVSKARCSVALWVALSAMLGAPLSPPLSHADDDLLSLARLYFAVLPDAMPGSEQDTPQQIALGKALYFETALSSNQTQSCNTCHDLRPAGGEPGAGVDHQPTSPGANGDVGRRNTPTTWNAGLQFAQFWDGRANTLEEQARSPILNPKEMALTSETEATLRLAQAGYSALFESAFPDQKPALTFDNILNALAAFQRTLITRDRLDGYLRGNTEELSAQEQQGMREFIRIGCNACHNGPLLGGNAYMKLGIVKPYPNTDDLGRAEITQRPVDRFFFKVPPLRNISKTAPYFHDGAVATLEQTVFGTALHQLGVELNDDQVNDITAFLNTMNNQRTVETPSIP